MDTDPRSGLKRQRVMRHFMQCLFVNVNVFSNRSCRANIGIDVKPMTVLQRPTACEVSVNGNLLAGLMQDLTVLGWASIGNSSLY